MIFISLVACIGSSIILVIFGAPSTDENSKYYGVYIGTCMYTHISEFVFENVCIAIHLSKICFIRIFFVLGLLGYFVSWQFGSCYSWIARKGDITGLLAPLFLIGCGTGGSIFPPVTGAVFRYIHYFTIFNLSQFCGIRFFIYINFTLHLDLKHGDQLEFCI